MDDETTDVSTIEQFSLCVRYIDDESKSLREDFLQFVPVTDVSGKNLANVINTTLSKMGINMQYLRGQGYDGAASMSSRFRSAQAYIKEVYPQAVYIHCGAHCLNLAISNACSLIDIKNCIGTVTYIYIDFLKHRNAKECLKMLLKQIYLLLEDFT